MRRVTINDVAEEAGVSRQTVSRAINDKGEISAETRDRVLAAVEKLAYRPNRMAQGMVTQRTHTIGLELADITNPVFAEIVRGAQDVALEHDYHLVLANSIANPTMALEALLTLSAQGVDAIIGVLARSHDEQTLNFASSFRPLVLINRHLEHPNISSVGVDIYQGAVLATQHFIEQGHRAIGMLATDAPLLNVRRVGGYRDTLRKAGLPTNEGWIAQARTTLQGGHEATTQLLTTFPEITALVAYNDLMAVGALRACHDMGRKVPEQCAIIGFDDIPLAAMVVPALSTISYDKYALGQEAVRRALAMLDSHESDIDPVMLDLHLVQREST